MLAELGYVAYAPDLFGQKVESREQMMHYSRSLAGDAQGCAYDALADQRS